MSKPYDEYINKTLDKINDLGTMTPSPEQLREFLIDAWMDGLKYSLVMIESEKRNREL